MVDEIQRLMNENALLTAKDKLLMTINDGLREKQARDADEILGLRAEIALLVPRDAERIHKLKSELDVVWLFNETSNNLLDITKQNLKQTEKKNKDLEKGNKYLQEMHEKLKKMNKKLEEDLKHYTDMENSKKKVIELHLQRIEQAEKAKNKDHDELQEIEDLKGLEKLSMLDPAVR
jgi:ribosomal protein L20